MVMTTAPTSTAAAPAGPLRDPSPTGETRPPTPPPGSHHDDDPHAPAAAAPRPSAFRRWLFEGAPDGLTLAFMNMQPLIYKAHAEPLSQADFLPLSGYMTAAEVLASFEAMMAGLIWRRPRSDCATTDPSPDGGAAPHAHPRSHPHPPDADANADEFEPLPTQAAVREALRTTRDRARLYATQGRGLLALMVRLVGRHLLLGMVLGVCRSASVVLQVWSLWTIIRVANKDPDYDYSKGVQFVVAAMLPLGAYFQSTFQHNVFHASTRAALIMRTVAVALVFEKLKVMTPLTLGSHAAADGADAKATKSLSLPPPAAAATPGAAADDGGSAAPAAPQPQQHAAPPPAAAAPSYAGLGGGVSTGQLINYISSDANSVVEAVIMGPMSATSVTDLCICIAWIGWVIGWAAAPLAGAVLIIFFFQMWCGARVAGNKILVAKIGDQRLRALTEFLSGIQVVKFYAWEANVRVMISALRRAEAALHVAGNVWKLLSLATIFFSGGIFAVVVFAVKLSYDGEMDAADTFVTMALIANITRAFQMLPRAITCLGTASASMARIEAFLAADVVSGLPAVSAQQQQQSPPMTPSDGADFAAAEDEGYDEQLPAFVPRDEANANTTTGAAVALSHHGHNNSTANNANAQKKNTKVIAAAASSDDSVERVAGLHVVGDFGWAGFAVRGLHLVCPAGSLTVVIGSVGSGKSTLLQAVLGVCGALSADYRVERPGSGSVAYVAQEAFIYDATVRENITFGQPFDEAKYRRVVKACSLVADLQQWGGDLVEVSASTLSGGQRQRLSLARACYADADLYVVDDPISAVDAAVGRHLLEKCFRGYLKGKTILLATHHPAPARLADQVVVMEHGVARVCAVSAESKAVMRQLAASAEVSPALPPALVATADDVERAILRLDTEGPFLDGSDDDGVASSSAAGAAAGGRQRSSACSVTHDRFGFEAGRGDGDGSDGEAAAAAAEAEAPPLDEAAQDAALDALIGRARALHVREGETAGAVPLGVYRAYIRGGGVTLCAVTAVLFFVSQGIRTVQDWWFSAWTRKEYPELSNDQCLYILGILVGAMVVVSVVRTFFFGFFTINASSALHDAMFEAVIASPLRFFEQVPLGRVMNRFSKDLDYCDDLLPRTLFDFLQLVLMILGSLALLVYAIPWFAIALPFAFAVFAYLIHAFMPSSRYMKRIEGMSRSPSMNTFQTVVGGLTTLRVYGRLDFFQAAFFSASDVTTNALLHAQCTQRWMGLRMDWVSVFWVLAAAFLAVGMMEDMGPSLVGLCLSQSVQVTGMLQFAIRMAAETENLMTSAERLDEYGSLPAEANAGTLLPGAAAVAIAPPKDDAADSSAAAADVGAATAAVPMPPSQAAASSVPASWPEGCDIAVRGLTMAYESNPDAPVLRDLHFTIRAGQRVAVVGRTGAGKSSLLAAFYRTTPIPSGSITIGGVATTDMDVFAMRARLGIIPQVPTLFHGTFRYNLDPFGRYSDAAMLEALQKVTLYEYVAARQGLDTSVGEGGANLSVGQKQLLCAARVLLTGASILFMDEATANIDEATDDKIQQIMREEAARRQMTIITIAHRLNTVMDYDLVLVMSHGRLVEYGNPRALVAAGTAGAAGADEAGTAAAVFGPVASADGDFVTNVQSEGERRQFAAMAAAMDAAHIHGREE